MKSDFIFTKTSLEHSQESVVLDRPEGTIYCGYHIIFTGEKGGDLILNGITEVFPPNYVVLLSPSCSLVVPHNNEGMYIIGFTSVFYIRNHRDAAFLQDNLLFFGPTSYYSLYIPAELQQCMHYVLTLFEKSYPKLNQPLYRNLIHTLLESILLQITILETANLQEQFVDDREHVIVAKFRTLIPEHIRKTRTVSTYAKKLNVSVPRLHRATRDVLAKTPKEVITEYILEEFKWKLTYTDLTIKEIAHEYGFFDPNNFSSFFLKEVGMRPSEYRKRQRRVEDKG